MRREAIQARLRKFTGFGASLSYRGAARRFAALAGFAKQNGVEARGERQRVAARSGSARGIRWMAAVGVKNSGFELDGAFAIIHAHNPP